jgi:hypothetical protein
MFAHLNLGALLCEAGRCDEAVGGSLEAKGVDDIRKAAHCDVVHWSSRKSLTNRPSILRNSPANDLRYLAIALVARGVIDDLRQRLTIYLDRG